MADDGLLDADGPAPGRASMTDSRVWGMQRERAWDWGVALVVLAAYAAGQFVFLEGPHPYDPAKYFETAVDFPDVLPDLWTLRIGVVAPLVAVVGLLGESEVALYTLPFLVGLAVAAAVYLTMLFLFRQRVLAAAAALVAALNTNWLLNSSYVFPDTMATATFTAAFLLLIFAGARARERHDGRLATIAIVGAGVLLGWTALTRDFSPLFVPAVLAVVLLLGYRLRQLAILVAAAGGTLLLDPLHGLVVHGDPLIHARALRAHRGSEEIAGPADSVVEVLVLFPRLLLSWRSGWAFILLLALFVAALALVRDRRLWLLAAWFFSFWAFMTALGLASLPSERWLVNVTNIRYWYPAFPPLVMGAFGALALLVRRFVSRNHAVLASSGLAVALAALTLGPGFVEFENCSAKNVWTRDPAARWNELRAWLATPEAARYRVIWTDYRSQRLVPVFARTTFGERQWHGQVEQFSAAGRRVHAPSNPDGALILVHKDRLEWIGNSPARLRKLRDEWRPLFLSSDGRMVVLAHESTTAGSSAPAGAWWTLTRPAPQSIEGCGLRPGHRDRAAPG